MERVGLRQMFCLKTEPLFRLVLQACIEHDKGASILSFEPWMIIERTCEGVGHGVVSVRRKILKGEKSKHIDRWTLDFNALKHHSRDRVRNQPEIALHYLRANYPPDVVEQIADRLADHERGRLLVLCLSCEPFVAEDKLQVRPRGELESRTRVCDYDVDPVVVTSSGPHERWQDHTVDEQLRGHGAAVPSSAYVLGRSLHEFAPAVAALTDYEEMVACALGKREVLRISLYVEICSCVSGMRRLIDM